MPEESHRHRLLPTWPRLRMPSHSLWRLYQARQVRQALRRKMDGNASCLTRLLTVVYGPSSHSPFPPLRRHLHTQTTPTRSPLLSSLPPRARPGRLANCLQTVMGSENGCTFSSHSQPRLQCPMGLLFLTRDRGWERSLRFLTCSWNGRKANCPLRAGIVISPGRPRMSRAPNGSERPKNLNTASWMFPQICTLTETRT